MIFIILPGMNNFFSILKGNYKFPDFDFIICTLFVTLGLLVLCNYFYDQIQRFTTYHYWLHIVDSVLGNTIYNRESCPICLGEFKAPARASCGHAFCMSCLLLHFQYNNYYWKCNCPLCRSLITDFDCLYKYPFSKTERTGIKLLENQLRNLIIYQNLQLGFVQRFGWLHANKRKILISVSITFIAFATVIFY